MQHNAREIMLLLPQWKYLENSLIASSNKRKDSILYVPILFSLNFIFYMHIYIISYVEPSQMQDPGHLSQRNGKMLTVFCTWFHLWQGKGVSQAMWGQCTEGGAIEYKIKKCFSNTHKKTHYSHWNTHTHTTHTHIETHTHIYASL